MNMHFKYKSKFCQNLFPNNETVDNSKKYDDKFKYSFMRHHSFNHHKLTTY